MLEGKADMIVRLGQASAGSHTNSR
jgi:hypothetical protein